MSPASGQEDEAGGGGGGAQPVECVEVLPARIWKLTPDQYTNTVRAMIPGTSRPGDALSGSLSYGLQGLGNRADALEMTEPHVSQLFDTAVALSDEALGNPGRLYACLGNAISDRACLRAFVMDFGQKGLRRPLTSEEVERYLGFIEREAPSHGIFPAVRMFIRALLLSPELLFRTELGPVMDGPPEPMVVELTPFEKASALSYLFLDGPPDQELFDAARGSKLGSAPEVEAQVRRLLASAEKASGVLKLFEELLHLKEVPYLRKTRRLYPDYTTELGADLAEETRRFVRHVLWQDGGRLSTLLTASYSILNPRLADYYGVPRPPGGGFARVDFPKGQRAGLMTQGSVMASLSTESDTRPVERGKFIRERLLCQALPPPPPTVRPIVPPAGGVLTGRERLAQHTRDESCKGCHELMDPLGFALESWNAVGKFRVSEYGKPIDTSGQLVGVREAPVGFSGAPELFSVLAGEPRVSECFVRTAYDYVHGEPVSAGGRCKEASQALPPLLARFAETGGDILDILARMTTTPGYFLRQAGGGAP